MKVTGTLIPQQELEIEAVSVEYLPKRPTKAEAAKPGEDKLFGQI